MAQYYDKINDADKKKVVHDILNHSQGLFGLIERDKYFEPTIPYPARDNYEINRPCSECGHKHEDADAKAAYDNDMREYRDEKNRLLQLFKFAALTDCGIEKHLKADKAFEMAWSRGHSSGYYEVLQELEELAELLGDTA